MPLALNRLILYARDVERTVAFYERHFGFQVRRVPGDRIVELVAAQGGANILVHAAAKGVRTGQVTVKLVFGALKKKKQKNFYSFGLGTLAGNGRSNEGRWASVSLPVFRTM